MSEFGNFLRSILPAEIPLTEHAQKLGVHPAALGRYMRGDRLSCNATTLAKMSERISRDKAVQAGLVAAYLRTQRVGPARHLVEISVDSGSSRISETPDDDLIEVIRSAHLDEKSTQALREIVRMLPQSIRLRRTLRNIADLARDLEPDPVA